MKPSFIQIGLTEYFIIDNFVSLVKSLYCNFGAEMNKLFEMNIVILANFSKIRTPNLLNLLAAVFICARKPQN
jgi:hypothetical protein